MKTYKVKDNYKTVLDDDIDCSGKTITKYSDITDLEFSLLASDLIDGSLFSKEDFVYADFEDGKSNYILKSGIEETEYFTKDDVENYALDLLKFLTDHDEIAFNPVLKKWDTRFGKGFQNNEELIKFFEANKSKLNVDQYTYLLQSMREQTFHMNDEQAKEIVDNFVCVHPDLLRYRDLEWFYKNV